MSPISRVLGFWSALLSAFLFITFTACFVVILVSNPHPAPSWTSLADYVSRSQSTNQTPMHIAQLCMLLFCPLFVVQLNGLHDCTEPRHRIWSRISRSFALSFCTLTSMLYFIQLSTVRLAVASGHTDSIEPFLQFYPFSAMLSVGMLGMTLFLGLSSLFIAPVFHKSRFERTIRSFFVINGICCLTGGIGYVLNQTMVIHFSINLGMGLSLIVLSILLALYFKRFEPRPHH